MTTTTQAAEPTTLVALTQAQLRILLGLIDDAEQDATDNEAALTLIALGATYSVLDAAVVR